MTRAPAENPAGPEPTEAKRTLRADVRRRRAARSEAERRTADAARTAILTDWLTAARPTRVAGYLSEGTEPATGGTVDWLSARGVELLLPASTGGAWSQPAWATYAGPDRLRLGPRGIAEPDSSDRLPAATIAGADVLLCPGLAGTPRGDRLGRGGGWYDRALPHATGTLVLLLNDDEILGQLPTGPYDRRVDAIVTPSRWLDCRPAG